MKELRALALAFLFLVPAGGVGAEVGTAARPNPGFDFLKSLVGSWEAKAGDGVVSIRFQVISNGTAVMETTDEPGHADAMVTVYHPDGARLLMTHYCSANNQPRMQCVKPSADGKSLTFEFVDCSNLPTPETGHMHGLTITLEDADHMSEEWTWMEAGRAQTETFHIQRKKA
jgi:hypothetical protein